MAGFDATSINRNIDAYVDNGDPIVVLPGFDYPYFREKVYEKCIAPCVARAFSIILPYDETIANDVVPLGREEEKLKEAHWSGAAGAHGGKRLKGGAICEKAVRMAMGESLGLDASTGPSKNYAHPDLEELGIPIGVKGADADNENCPMTFDNPRYEEIICAYSDLGKKGYKVWILGVATVSVQRRFSHKFLVKMSSGRAYKTGFYGARELWEWPKDTTIKLLADAKKNGFKGRRIVIPQTPILVPGTCCPQVASRPPDEDNGVWTF
jgi:hypothetical protein